MSVPLWCSRADIFSEFTVQEQDSYFNLKQKKVISDYDNFYYSVFLKYDAHDIERACKEYGTMVIDSYKNIEKFISELQAMREVYDFKSGVTYDFYGFDYLPFGLKFYNNRLSLNECFDILICDVLPNDKTPRIMVQIRARFLWLYGFKKAFNDSFKALKDLLNSFGIEMEMIKENRIDYAFHTNSIQSFEKAFDRKRLSNLCRTNARIYQHIGDPQHNWSIDTFTVGSRSSKTVFFRAYNKTREVVEKAYKCFFIKVWFDNGLISQYDKYCLEKAYQMKSYDVGLLVGRIKWYLEFGKNVKLKEELKSLLEECYSKSDNSTAIRKAISGVLPEVTVICNMEFETHTDFYRSFNPSMPMFATKIKPTDLRYRCFTIYECRKSYIDYLTRYGGFISFVKDNSVKLKDFTDDMYLNFWKRIRSCKIGTKYKPELIRSYERNVDVERAKRRLVSNVSVLSFYKKGLNYNDLNEDLSDALSYLNDNDMCTYDFNARYDDHDSLKIRLNRQYRTLFPSTDQSED